MVSSKLGYCNALLASLPKQQTNRLQHVMDCVARIVTGTSKFEHITLALKTLHWLPVEFRILFKVVCLTYKALNGLAPSYLANLLHMNHPVISDHPAKTY